MGIDCDLAFGRKISEFHAKALTGSDTDVLYGRRARVWLYNSIKMHKGVTCLDCHGDWVDVRGVPGMLIGISTKGNGGELWRSGRAILLKWYDFTFMRVGICFLLPIDPLLLPTIKIAIKEGTVNKGMIMSLLLARGKCLGSLRGKIVESVYG